MSEITVLQSLEAPEFKELHKTSKLQVIENPKNGKLFVATAAGATVAAVSKNYDSKAGVKVFKHIQFEGDSAPIWVLSSNNNSANMVEEF